MKSFREEFVPKSAKISKIGSKVKNIRFGLLLAALMLASTAAVLAQGPRIVAQGWAKAVAATAKAATAIHKAASLAAGKPAAPASGARPSRLFKDSRQQLAIARAQGRSDVVVLVAAVEGGTAQVADEAEHLGGDVRYRDDEVGYLRVRIPIDHVNEFAESDHIESIALDRDDSYPGRLSTDGVLAPSVGPNSGDPGMLSAKPNTPQSQDNQQWPPKWGDYNLTHYYSPLKDIDAADFQAKHPTYDGRGVTIALLDGNFDLLLPEFQNAYDLNGKTIPKVADYRNMTDPRDDSALVPQWLDMKAEITAQGGHVTYEGKTFTTPHDGTFRIGLFSERRFNNPSDGAYIDQDLDRDGNPKGDDGLFGVLWDEKTNDVWVDTNRNLNFTDDKAMTDYHVRYDVGQFGKDDPSTPIRESIGFVVQTDPKNKFIAINCGFYQHATEIMGSVVGNRTAKGARIQGIAPGARLMSLFYGVGNAHAMCEALIYAFKNPEVDLIVMEQHVGIMSMSYLLSDARHPISIVAQRLIDRYHKLMFVPGGNSPGFALVAEDGQAPGAVSAGGYQSSESYRLNAGFTTEHPDNMHWGALSHGPSGIGALKPDFLAPSGQMSTDLRIRKGASIKGLMELPPGYAIDGGTSTATPMACGSTALVVSAAKQTHVPYDAERLKTAMMYSARYIPNLTEYEQGNGVVQVEAAYELLKKLGNVQLIKITSKAPVKTNLSRFLHTPDQGVGIYEREGWAVGDSGTRTITFTRTTGPAEPMTFAVSWQGNDGTFNSGNSVTLPLNSPVEFPVQISVKEQGAHSSILTLDNPSIPGHVYRMLNTVVGALQFNAEKKYTVSAEITVPRPGDRSVFIYVPAGAGALTFSGTSEDTSFRFSALSPSRDDFYFYSATPGQPVSIPHPEPGVWEINVCINWFARDYDPDRELPIKATTAKVTATLLGVDVSADAAGGESFTAGSAANIPVKITNRYSTVKAAAANMSLGSAFQTNRSIAQGEQHMYEVTVPKGATSLRARVSGVSDSSADLDVYLLDCTHVTAATPPAMPEKEKGNKSAPMPEPNCIPKAKAIAGANPGEVEIVNPAPGRWVIVVDAYSVPSGHTNYSYMDVFTQPSLGAIAVADSPSSRESGSSWTSSAHIWTASTPESPRFLQCEIAVTSPDYAPYNGTPIVLGQTDLSLGAPQQTQGRSARAASAKDAKPAATRRSGSR